MIFEPDDGYEWYLCPGFTDMRRHASSLSVDAQVIMKKDPFSKSVFVFCNSGKNIIRLIVWDCNGFWELSKKLDKSTYKWPKDAKEAKEVTPQEIILFLKGGDPWRKLPELRPLYYC